MTRETLWKAKTRTFRADGNLLFFNNLMVIERQQAQPGLVPADRFAQAVNVPLSNQLIATVVHRPASRPGAD
jgi:hypothetical protein